MPNDYVEGQQVVCQFSFKDAAGNGTDPADAALTVKQPDGTLTAYTLAQATRVSTGVYTLTVDTTAKPGRWFYRGSGDNGAETNETWFHVTRSAL